MKVEYRFQILIICFFFSSSLFIYLFFLVFYHENREIEDIFRVFRLRRSLSSLFFFLVIINYEIFT